jgi:hypothetical protein
MYYKQEIKDKVRLYRRKGLSLGQIFQKTGVPRSTIRLWIKDIFLSWDQAHDLKARVQKALQQGRIKSQKIRKEERNINEKILFERGVKDIGELSKKELLIAGISLYWAEGFKNKHEHRLGFCNSDPEMIKFYVYWLKECLGIEKKQLVARLTLNYIYEKRVDEIQEFWSYTIGIPIGQFTKPFFQTSKWKKQYDAGNYHGVLRIHVQDSLEYLLKMKGWIDGLKDAKIKRLPG